MLHQLSDISEGAPYIRRAPSWRIWEVFISVQVKIATVVMTSIGALFPLSALAGTVNVEGFCWTAHATATGFSEPTPYQYSWSNTGSVSYSSFCPTSGGTYANCGLMCLWPGNGSVTVSVRDGNGALLGTDSANFTCFYDPNGSLMISSCL